MSVTHVKDFVYMTLLYVRQMEAFKWIRPLINATFNFLNTFWGLMIVYMDTEENKEIRQLVITENTNLVKSFLL